MMPFRTWRRLGAILLLTAAFAAGCAGTGEELRPGAQAPSPAQNAAAARAGMQALEAGRLDAAAALSERLLRQEPGNAEAGLLAAEVRLAQGALPEAEAAFARLTGAAAPDIAARALQGQGLALAAAGDPAAQAVLQRAVQRDARLWRAWNALGYLHDLQRAWTLAARSYEMALAAAPRAAEVLNNRGYSRLLQGRHGEARADFSAALAADPMLRAARENLRLALAWEGRYDEALLGAGPAARPQVLNNVGFVALLRGDYERAERLFLQAMETDPAYNDAVARNLARLDDLRAIGAPAD